MQETYEAHGTHNERPTENLHEGPALFGVVTFANYLDRSEPQTGAAVCFLGSHANAGVFVRLGRNVRLHLFLQPFVSRLFTATEHGHDAEKACEEPPQAAHAR